MIKSGEISRRDALKGGAMITGLAAATSALPAWMPRLAFAQPYNNPRGDVMIVIFLRGGADALNMIVPYAEDDYYAARPQLAIPRPDAAGEALKTLDLDGFFGVHPALEPLVPLFQSGAMSAVHACGSPHETRSHFEAMGFMERGAPGAVNLSTGWVGRHLATLDTDNPSPIRGIGWGTAIQAALVGAPSVAAMRSIVDYHLEGDDRVAAQLLESLTSLYALESESLAASVQATRGAIDVVASVGYADYVPKYGAAYPESDFAMALRQSAALIRADVGLEAACIDLGGWDTHVNQGGVEGAQAGLMADLASGLAAFYQDMGPEMNGMTVVVMSEFGRRLVENANAGTDHGHGGAMLVMSDNLARGPVVADWRGLEPDALDLGRDLAITTDYRDVLSELLLKRLNNPGVNEVFPDYAARDLGLFA